MQTNSPFQPSALQLYKIDLTQSNDNLIDYIKHILTETQSHKSAIMDKEFWEWQYKNTPGNHTCVYAASYQDKIIGYYHVPVYEGIVGGKPGLLAMIQDVAVDASMRGMGIFSKLATFANKDIDTQSIDACYTFPNEKSIHTFLKYNAYTFTKTLSTYILPIDTTILLRKKLKIPFLPFLIGKPINLFFAISKKYRNTNDNIQTINKFDTQVEKLYCIYSEKYQNYVKRTVSYLEWRYNQRPYSLYFTLGYHENAQLTAICTFKIDKMFSVPVLLLMDYAFTNADHFLATIYHASVHSYQYTKEKVAFLFTACCDIHFENLSKKYFWRIPEYFNPRKLNMLTRNVQNQSPVVHDASKWFVTLGDWDVF